MLASLSNLVFEEFAHIDRRPPAERGFGSDLGLLLRSHKICWRVEKIVKHKYLALDAVML